jgi:hypothetical protein
VGPEGPAGFEGHADGFVEDFDQALAALFAEPGDGTRLARLLMGADLDQATAIVFSEALFDPNLGYRGFRFLAAAWMVFGEKEPGV